MRRLSECASMEWTKILLLSAIVILSGISPSAFGYQTQAGDNPHGPLDYACNACHSTAGWGELRPDPSFTHNATEFPLEGQHRFVECRQCHDNLTFSQTQSSCYDCHTDIHEGQFANECERCHSPSEWDDEGEFRRMHQQTRFPLVGVHSTLDCQSCHEGGEYATLSPTCEACHYDTFLNTREPDHSQAGFRLTVKSAMELKLLNGMMKSETLNTHNHFH